MDYFLDIEETGRQLEAILAAEGINVDDLDVVNALKGDTIQPFSRPLAEAELAVMVKWVMSDTI